MLLETAKKAIAPRAKVLLQPLAPHRLVILETRNRLLFWPKAVKARHFEDIEVARLASEIVTLPRAEVVTVVITYRRPELLLRAVESALAQSVRDHAVIVVDDGGGLPDLPSDPRLLAVSLSANTGVLGLVRNVGIRLSRSRYIAFLDDDNEWKPNHLETALEEFGGSATVGERLDIVYTAVQRLLPDGKLMDVLSNSFSRTRFVREGGIDVNSLVVRRSPRVMFSRIERPRHRYPKDDWELLFRLTRRMKIKHIPVETVQYLVNPASYFSTWKVESEAHDK